MGVVLNIQSQCHKIQWSILRDTFREVCQFFIRQRILGAYQTGSREVGIIQKLGNNFTWDLLGYRSTSRFIVQKQKKNQKNSNRYVRVYLRYVVMFRRYIHVHRFLVGIVD